MTRELDEEWQKIDKLNPIRSHSVSGIAVEGHGAYADVNCAVKKDASIEDLWCFRNIKIPNSNSI